MPPHKHTALRAHHPHPGRQVNLVELFVFYMILLVIFAGVRRNDKQMRTTFFLQQRTAERLQREKERLGWDVHLITKRLEQQASYTYYGHTCYMDMDMGGAAGRPFLPPCTASFPSPSPPCLPPARHFILLHLHLEHLLLRRHVPT